MSRIKRILPSRAASSVRPLCPLWLTSLSKTFLLALLTLPAGCALHPKGEGAERERAAEAGKPFEKAFHERELPPLADDAPWQEFLRHAFLASGELEERYWEWRAAIEDVPIQASPRTTAAFFFNHLLNGSSSTFWDRTTVAVGNDPMFNLPWPGKLATAGRLALEKARAAGLRFEKAKFDLQAEVIEEYSEWALLAERIRIAEANLALLDIVARVADANVRSGSSPHQDILKAQTERDLAGNELETLRSRLAGARAKLNALIGRPPDAPLAPPASPPAPRRLAYGEGELLLLMAERNPELAELAREAEAKREGIHLAKLEFIPDFSVSASTDLGGAAQTIAGMITAPVLRYEALRAGLVQARAELRALDARRRQAGNDLVAAVIADFQGLRNIERQASIFAERILPRTEAIVETTRSSYAAGRASLIDLLDGQRTRLDIRAMFAELRAEREKLLARLEARAAVDIESKT